MAIIFDPILGKLRNLDIIDVNNDTFDDRYVNVTTNQQVSGEKQLNQNLSMKAEKKIIFDAS
jgi:hypothetical protein